MEASPAGAPQPTPGRSLDSFGFITHAFAGRAAATVAGGAYLVIQGATYAGYIEGVNWSRMERDLVRVLDKDNDGARRFHSQASP